MVVLKNQNRRSGIFYLRPLCGFGFFSKSEVDDPPKIAGRYTKGAECSAGWLLWNSVCQSIAELTSY